MTSDLDRLERRERIAKAARIGVPLAVVLVLGVAIWRFASNTAGERREVPQVPVVALTPPPPPPPPPPPKEKPPEPQKTIETPAPTPTPQPPKPEAPQKSDAPKQLTMNADAQSGSDNFGVAAGKGGGLTVGGDPNGGDGPGGGDFGAANYGVYLKSALQQAVQSDDQVSHRVFAAAQVNIWIDPSGRITNVTIARSSGDARTDRALVAALKQIGRLDEPPPPHLQFPAHVSLSGRRT